jgi:hypothetical protein
VFRNYPVHTDCHYIKKIHSPLINILAKRPQIWRLPCSGTAVITGLMTQDMGLHQQEIEKIEWLPPGWLLCKRNSLYWDGMGTEFQHAFVHAEKSAFSKLNLKSVFKDGHQLVCLQVDRQCIQPTKRWPPWQASVCPSLSSSAPTHRRPEPSGSPIHSS